MSPEKGDLNEYIDKQLRLTELTATLKDLRDFIELYKQHYPEFAAAQKAYFDSLVTAGFTEPQALEIVKSRGWVPNS